MAPIHLSIVVEEVETRAICVVGERWGWEFRVRKGATVKLTGGCHKINLPSVSNAPPLAPPPATIKLWFMSSYCALMPWEMVPLGQGNKYGTLPQLLKGLQCEKKGGGEEREIGAMVGKGV